MGGCGKGSLEKVVSRIMETPISVLRSFPELAPLSDTDLTQMAKQLRHLQYRKGAMLCREGDDGDCCYLLVRGSVQINKNLPDGRCVHLASLSSNVIIGQTGLVSGQSRTAQVRASTDVELLSLHRKPYLWALQQGAPWAIRFIQMVSVDLVRQIRNAMERLDALVMAEDVDAEVEGEIRVEQKKEYINMTGFQGGDLYDEAPHTEEEVYRQPHRNQSSPDLLKLLQSTERGLGHLNVDLDEVSFVNDDDMQK